MTLYLNTPDNAARVGWLRCLSKCIGPADAKYVTHEPRHGLFWFHNEIDARRQS